LITIIKITTPEGQAQKMEKRLKPFILGVAKLRHIMYVSRDDSIIIWVIEAPIKRMLKIKRNVGKFDHMVQLMFKNKLVKKQIKKMTEEQQDEIISMLKHHTSVDIVNSI